MNSYVIQLSILQQGAYYNVYPGKISNFTQIPHSTINCKMFIFGAMIVIIKTFVLYHQAISNVQTYCNTAPESQMT